jgi:hypothetical protein
MGELEKGHQLAESKGRVTKDPPKLKRRGNGQNH